MYSGASSGWACSGVIRALGAGGRSVTVGTVVELVVERFPKMRCAMTFTLSYPTVISFGYT